MTIANPLFSVVIPTYNRSTTLKVAIESVLGQRGECDYELIVIDDGSTDDTADVLASLASLPNVLVIHQKNAGQAAARNLAVLHSRGRYIAFLDSDDYWFPWTLGVFREAIEAAKNPMGVVGKALEFSDTHPISYSDQDGAHFHIFDGLLDMPPGSAWLGIGASAIRRDALRKVGGFHTKRMNFEDLDLWLRLSLEGSVVVVTQPHTLAYRIHDSSVTTRTILSVRGILHICSSEFQGRYPGGTVLRSRRRAYVSLLARSVSLGLARRGWRSAALVVYTRTFWLNFTQRRIKFLLGLPIAVARSLLTSSPRIGSP